MTRSARRTAPVAGGELVLRPAEATAVAEVTRAFAEVLPAGRDDEFTALAVAAEHGTVPAELAGRLEQVCALALQTGKAKALGTAETERLVAAVYRRTPAGAALTASTDAANAALAGLAGRSLRRAAITARVPGHYRLELSVDAVTVTLGVTADGVTVDSVNAG